MITLKECIDEVQTLKDIPTGELYVRRIRLRKDLSESAKRFIDNGPHKGEENAQIIEARFVTRSLITEIDKELKRRDSEQRNS